MQRPKDKVSKGSSSGFTRRRFLQGVGAAGAGAVLAGCAVKEHSLITAAPPATPPNPFTDQIISGPIDITLDLNGESRKVTVEPRTTLLSALRDRLDPACTGPKLVCNAATCGACTVIIDGKTAYGCSVLAIDAVGKKISTVDGFGSPDKMNAVQAAFVEKDGMMCGFCTSGFVTSITALLRTNPNPTLDEVKQGCHGNFCRCGTYPHVFEAALAAAKDKTRSV
jgi:xanthine dehydrogenase YagT iron-sulfur-binding subunit